MNLLNTIMLTLIILTRRLIDEKEYYVMNFKNDIYLVKTIEDDSYNNFIKKLTYQKIKKIMDKIKDKLERKLEIYEFYNVFINDINLLNEINIKSYFIDNLKTYIQFYKELKIIKFKELGVENIKNIEKEKNNLSNILNNFRDLKYKHLNDLLESLIYDENKNYFINNKFISILLKFFGIDEDYTMYNIINSENKQLINNISFDKNKIYILNVNKKNIFISNNLKDLLIKENIIYNLNDSKEKFIPNIYYALKYKTLTNNEINKINTDAAKKVIENDFNSIKREYILVN